MQSGITAGNTGGAGDPPWVFLSYSRSDQPTALKVLAALEAAGINVWWDGLLPGGARYNDVTEHRLENAYAVVALWSATSTHSHWVHDEAMRGRDRGCLVPASIDGSEPPLGFRQFQWVTLVDGKGEILPAAMDTLIQSIGRLHPDATDTAKEPSRQPANRPAGMSKVATGGGFRIDRRMAIGGGAVAALLGAGALAWKGGLIGGSHGNSVAILPFNRSGGSPDQAYFANGLAAEIRSRLARNPLLKVAAEASSRSVSETDADAREIARKLKVAYLLEGTVAREQDRLAVRVDLIDGGDGTVVVPLEFDQTVESIFDIQGAIAAKVASELASQMDGGSAAEAIGGTRSVAAYEAFLRGNELYAAGETEADDREALARYEEAIRIDPNYAAAHAAKGLLLTNIGNLHAAPAQRDGLFEQAIGAGKEAVRIAPKFAQGHFVIGFALAMGKLDMKAARAPYQKAYELGAGDAEIITRYAIFRSRIGDTVKAEAEANRAIGLDPLNDRTFRLKGDVLYAGGRPAEAIGAFDQARAIGGTKGSYWYRVGLAQLELGQSEAARDSFAQDPFPVWMRTGGAIAEHRLGNRSAAEAHLAALQAEYGDKSSYQYGQIYAQWGDRARSLAALADAWRLKDAGLSQLYRDPLLAPVRDSGDYQSLVKKIGFV